MPICFIAVPKEDDGGDVRRSSRRFTLSSMIQSVRGLSPTSAAAAAVAPPMDIGTPTKFTHNIKIEKAPDGTFTGIDGLPGEMLEVSRCYTR